MRKYLPYLGIVCLIIAGLLYSTSKEPRESLKSMTSSSVVPLATVDPFVKPVEWETYQDSSFGYTISFPPGFEVQQNGEGSIQILKEQPPMGVGPTNFIYISVVTPDKLNAEGVVYNYNISDYQKLEELSVSEMVSFSSDGQLAEYFTYRRYPDKKITEEILAKQFVNEKPWEFPEGTKETRFIFVRDNRIFLVGAYIKPETVSDHFLSGDLFNKIISTITF